MIWWALDISTARIKIPSGGWAASTSRNRSKLYCPNGHCHTGMRLQHIWKDLLMQRVGRTCEVSYRLARTPSRRPKAPQRTLCVITRQMGYIPRTGWRGSAAHRCDAYQVTQGGFYPLPSTGILKKLAKRFCLSCLHPLWCTPTIRFGNGPQSRGQGRRCL